jgi:HSP20 family molecular chaperone IbpA
MYTNYHLLNEILDWGFITKEPFNSLTDSVSSKGDVYIAKVILPGIEKKNISIKGNKELLKIFVKDSNNKQTLYRTFNLKGLVDLDSITSKLKNGILEITLPKVEVSESVEIKIN